MRLSPRAVTADYAVHGQLTPADIVEAQKLGFRSIINNRPDGEEPGQPEACTIAKAALAVGLDYAHIPVSGPITPAQTQAMQEALASLPQPVLAYCRSGARSTRLWAHAMQAVQGTDRVVQAAAQAGCDAAALKTELSAKIV